MNDNTIATPDFVAAVSQAKRRRMISAVISAIGLGAAWFLAENGRLNPSISSQGLLIALQYVAMLGTGFCIWYGIYNYDKTAELLKEKDIVEEKQVNYLKANNFRNMLIYISLIVDFVLYLLSGANQFVFTALCAVCFAFGAIPSISKFESDFFKEIIIEEEDGEEEQPQAGDNKEE